MHKWIADALLLPCIRIGLFPGISSYAEKSFSDALEILCQLLVHFLIYIFNPAMFFIPLHRKTSNNLLQLFELLELNIRKVLGGFYSKASRSAKNRPGTPYGM